MKMRKAFILFTLLLFIAVIGMRLCCFICKDNVSSQVEAEAAVVQSCCGQCEETESSQEQPQKSCCCDICEHTQSIEPQSEKDIAVADLLPSDIALTPDGDGKYEIDISALPLTISSNADPPLVCTDPFSFFSVWRL